MARNPLALLFRAPGRPLTLPDTPLLSAHGSQRLSELRGRTHIVSLWAEWCTPCLQEAPDLAAISRTHSGPSLGVIFVLTSSHKKLDFAAAQAVLAKRGAGDATLLVEPGGQEKVFSALATQDYSEMMRQVNKTNSGASLPCNLLIDRQGRVRARAFGVGKVMTHSEPMTGTVTSGKTADGTTYTVTTHTLTPGEKAQVLNEPTAWASPAGSEFAAALAAGLLEKA
jgi:thiol-disulfide isomerase/thioredoxin